MLRAFVGAVRLALLLVLVALGAVAMLLAALWPRRIREVRAALWVAVGLCRLFVALMGVRVACEAPEALTRHRGFVFFNHLSYLDPVVLLALGPMRFLSTEGVKALPFIGWMAAAVGTVFVDRGDAGSRAASRGQLEGKLRARPYPPVGLAPEGGIGPGGAVLPLRHGAFEIAAEAGVAIRPAVLHFAPHAAVVWKKREWLLRAVWRLAARLGGVTATVTPLAPVAPAAGAVAQQAREMEAAMTAALAQSGQAPVSSSSAHQRSQPSSERP